MKRFLLLGLVLFQACSSDSDPASDVNMEEPVVLMESIVSASVAFAYSNAEVQDFLTNPGNAYVSGYFYFEEDLAPDIIFGLDIEFLEGVTAPLRFEGADWMALAGFDRTGRLWFPIGYPENREGVPTDTDNWIVQDTGIELQPNSWYKMTIECDFNSLEFVSVRLEGNGFDETFAIAGNPLEYPNYAPFDEAALTGYTFALRGRDLAPDNAAGFAIYFDDIEMGVYQGSGPGTVIFQDGFENQATIGDIPIAGIPIPLGQIPEQRWYLENDKAKLALSSQYARTGQQSLRCRADLTQE
ncbi:MAG: hypothetical protein HRT65_04660 [Flavobacteriaceae bacterium]|nr:hypothetical protein [Flavobacteriaceae bacterium]